MQEGPETELERKRGFEDIQRSAAAGGKLRAGGTLESLTEFSSMLDARNRGQRFSELFSLATLGQQSAAGQATGTLGVGRDVAQTITGIGDVKAAGLIGKASQRRGTISDLARIAGGGI